MRLSNRATALCCIACVILVMIAGCATEPSGSSSEDTTTVTNTPTEESKITTTAAERTETTRWSRTTTEGWHQTTTEGQRKTTTEGIFGSIEHELQVRNYMKKGVNISVKIESANGTVIFDKTIDTDGNSSKYFDFEFPRTGEYKIVANTAFSSKNATWDIQRRNPSVAASVVLMGDNELYIQIEII